MKLKFVFKYLDLVPEFAKNNSLFVQTGKKSTKNKMMTGSQSSKERKQPVITNFIFDYKSSFIEPLARMNSL